MAINWEAKDQAWWDDLGYYPPEWDDEPEEEDQEPDYVLPIGPVSEARYLDDARQAALSDYYNDLGITAEQRLLAAIFGVDPCTLLEGK